MGRQIGIWNEHGSYIGSTMSNNAVCGDRKRVVPMEEVVRTFFFNGVKCFYKPNLSGDIKMDEDKQKIFEVVIVEFDDDDAPVIIYDDKVPADNRDAALVEATRRCVKDHELSANYEVTIRPFRGE